MLLYECWLVSWFGVIYGNVVDEVLFVFYMLLVDGGDFGMYVWVCVEFVYVEIVYDYLVFVDLVVFVFDDGDVVVLFVVVWLLIEEFGVWFEVLNLVCWYLLSD